MMRAADRLPQAPATEISAGSVSSFDFAGVDALAVFTAPASPDETETQPRSGAVDAGIRYGIDLGEILDRHDFAATSGEGVVLQLPRPSGGQRSLPWDGLPARLIVLGTGSGSPKDLLAAGQRLADAVRTLDRVAVAVDPTVSASDVQTFVEGYLLGAYPTTLAEQSATKATLVLLVGRSKKFAAAVRGAEQAASGTWLARHLTATPSNIKSPQWFARQAEALAKQAGLSVRTWTETQLRNASFGAIVAVGTGAKQPARLVEICYPGTGGRHVVVVGKGVTYDTGGLAIKPREGMVAMKTDMAGAAIALTTVLAAAETKSPHRVTALLPIAENAVSGAAFRPGDVLTLYDGTTVEVRNTDAEGRLLLADALAYARTELAPDFLVDVATLTGAATLALSRKIGAYFTADDQLAKAVERASVSSGEQVWRMPLVADYRTAMDSKVADVANISTKPHISGGAITAALFLQRFTAEVPWIHFDLAGPARSDRPGGAAGDATGFGARLLRQLLTELA